jgi:hypothetical protein
MTTHFRRACELWDGIAGPSDFEAFALAFDQTIAGLDVTDIDAVGQFIERLRTAKTAAGLTPPISRRRQVGTA